MASTSEYTPQIIKSFGGRRTFGERSECPPGMSPNCSDVAFGIDSVRSRAGLTLRYTNQNGINSIYSFYGTDRVRRTVILQNNGDLIVEAPEGISTRLRRAIAPNAMMKAVYAFNRLWMCFSDGKRPLDYPWQFDPAITDSPYFVGGLTLPMTPAEPDMRHMAVTLGGAGSGNISAGYHYFFFTYEDQYGFITGFSPVGKFNAAAADKATFANLDLGPVLTAGLPLPGSTARRRGWFTAAEVAGQGAAPFYNLPSFNLDNTTTNPVIDFIDSDLVSNGVLFDPSLTQVQAPPAIGVAAYATANRIALWGVYGGIPNRLTEVITPAGGTGSAAAHLGLPAYDFSTISDLNAPSALPDSKWAAVIAGSQSIVVLNGINAIDESGVRGGQIVVISGDTALAGPTLTTTFPLFKDSAAGDPQFWVGPGKRVGFLIRMKKQPPQPAGLGGWSWNSSVLRVSIATVTPNATLATRDFAPTEVSTDWAVYAIDGTALVPDTVTAATTVKIQLTFPAGPTGGLGIPLVALDWVRPFPQTAKFDGSTAWLSEFGQPEQFDLVKSPLPINPGDGQELRCCWEQNGNFYFAKERSLFVSNDNGQDPSAWTVDQLSPIVGTPSLFGVGLGPDFAIIASTDGAYYFDNGKLEKISQEIQTDWDAVDWTQGHLVWVAVDPRLKRVRIGVPLSTATGVCSQVFLCDYAEGWEDGSGGGGHGRKWSIDTVKTSCAEYGLRDNLTSRHVYGGRRTASNHLASDFGTADFTLGYAPSATVANQADPFGGTAAKAYTFPAAFVADARLTKTSATIVALGAYFVVSFWVKVNQGAITDNGGNPIPCSVVDPFGGPSVAFSMTASWQRVVAVFGPAPNGATAETISLIFQTSATVEEDIYLFGAQTQSGQYDQGYVTQATTNGESGFLSQEAEFAGTPGWQTYDWDGQISPVYETAPFALETGRFGVGRAIARIRGAGTLTGSYVLPDGATSGLLPQPTLASVPVHDVEMDGNQEGTFIGLRLSVAAKTAWFTLKRLALYLKEKTASPQRGHN